MPERARSVRRAAPLAAVLTLAALVGSARWAGSGAGGADHGAESTAPLAVSASSVYQFDDLASMVGAADLVVRGRVQATSRGRVVGDGDGAVVSRIDTLQVEEVLVGTAAGPTVLVEEEGWLLDGTAIAVNGLAPSEEGMDGIWFLDRRPDAELPGYLVINHQGRYVVDGDRLHGADGRDLLVEQLEGLGAEGLAEAVRRSPAAATTHSAG